MADPINALYDRDDPFGFGQDETERLRQSMTHTAPDTGLAAKIARDKAILGVLPPFKQLGGLWNALTSPMTAEETYGDPSALTKRALDLQSAQFTGAGFRRPSGASAGVFAGPKSATAMYDESLGMAKTMHERGFDKNQILDATDWFKGTEGAWKREIPDTHARIIGKPGKTYGDMLDHPELYEAYPWARDIPTEYNPKLAPNAATTWMYRGTHIPAKIEFGRGVFENPSTALHEIQHPIQRYEGFAMGGSHDVGKSPFLNDLKRLDDAHAAALQEVSQMKLGDPDYAKKLANLDRARMANDTARATHIHYMNARKKAAFDNYLRLAGEVEARNVQFRHANDLYAIPPWETEPAMRAGYTRNQQIITHEPVTVGPRVRTNSGNVLLDPMYERYK